MYLKKLKNNNKGADIALIGTNYILVLILVVCAVIDLMVIEYGKMTVVSILKEIEMYSLAKNYSEEQMWYGQELYLSDDTSRSIRKTCSEAFAASLAGDNSFMSNCCIATNEQGREAIDVNLSKDKIAIILTIPKVSFVPKKIFKGTSVGSRLSFIGQSMENMPSTGNLSVQQVHEVSVNGSDLVYTGCSMKLSFIFQ